MIVVVLVVGPGFHLNPVPPIFVLLGVGIHGMCRGEQRALILMVLAQHTAAELNRCR
jgi:hypothetical protein